MTRFAADGFRDRPEQRIEVFRSVRITGACAAVADVLHAYERYAERFLGPGQRDDVDPTRIPGHVPPRER